VALVPFDISDAETTADLWARTRHLGLSLADRTCLALAARLGVPAVTADRAWLDLDLGIEVVCVR
jgi:PIN domain nuclease of toxin-antitoxin system